MKRHAVGSLGIVLLVAAASLLTHAQGARFSPITDEVLRAPSAADWPAWRRDRAGTGYSPLEEISRANVRRL
jgi:glucose dehydrogenase